MINYQCLVPSKEISTAESILEKHLVGHFFWFKPSLTSLITSLSLNSYSIQQHHESVDSTKFTIRKHSRFKWVEAGAS